MAQPPKPPTIKDLELLTKAYWANLLEIYRVIYPGKTPKSASEVLAHVRDTLRMKDQETKAETARADMNQQMVEELQTNFDISCDLLEHCLEHWGNDFPRSNMHDSIQKFLGKDEAPVKPEPEEEEDIGAVSFS